MAHAHIRKLDHVHCRNELLARSLVCRKSIYIGDMALKYDGILRAYKLKPNHVPVTLDGLVDVIPLATCEDYLRAGQSLGTHFHIEEIFAGQNRAYDFDEIELGASSWQPKLDAIQEQIDDLDSTYAQDAEVVAAFATQIAASGDVFTLVTNKVAVETSRAESKEAEIQADVDANESAATADRQSIRGDFATADTVVSDSVAAEAVLARQKEGEIQADVDANESAATLDRQDIRADYVVADAVVNTAVQAEATLARLKEGEIQADVDANESTATADRLDIRADFATADQVVSDTVVAEAATARAKETENTNAIAAEKARIDVIVNLSPAALNNFAAIEQAYTAADNAADSALTALVTSKVASADLDTLVTAVDSVEANTLKRSNADNDARYYQRADVDSAVGLRVLQTAFDTAIGDRQTTAAQEAAYRKIDDSYTKTEVDSAVGLRVLQTAFDTAIGDRQTTAAQEAAYRKIDDSYLKSEVDSAVGLRVLQTDHNTAIAARQTTAVADGKYRLQSNSYTKTEVDTRDGLRVLTATYDPDIAARQTTAAADLKYRLQSDSLSKSAAETADGLRVLQTDHDTAIGDRQTTAAADLKYRLQSDSLSKSAAETADGLRVLTTTFDSAVADRQTTAAQEAAYRKIADSYDKTESYSQSEVDTALALKSTKAAPTLTGVVQCDNRIHVGTSGPSSYEAHAQQVVVRSHNDCGMSIMCPNDKKGHLIFGSADDADEHHIVAYHVDTGDYKNGLHFKVGGKDSECVSMTHQSTENRVGIDKKDPAYTLDVNGTARTANLIVSAAVPGTATTAGTTGEIRWDADYLYFCTAPTAWKRISTGTAW